MQTATNPQTGEKVQWNGSAWVPVGQAASRAPSGPMVVGTPRPKPPRVQQVGESLGIVGEDGSFTPTYTPPPKPKEGSGGGEATAKARTDAITAYQSAQAIRRTIADMQQKFQAGPGATSGPMGLMDFMPTEANRQFDAAGNAARGDVGRAMGFTGGQLNSVAEANMAVGPYLPESSDYDQVILDKIKRLEGVANDAEARAIAILGGRPDENGQITPVAAQGATGGDQMDRSASLVENYEGTNGTETLARSTNGTETIDDPNLAGVRGAYLRMLEQGLTPSKIMQNLERAGVKFDSRLRRSVVEQYNYRRKNPQVPLGNYDTTVLDDKVVSLSPVEDVLNGAAQTAGGAYAMRAGNMLSLNTMDSATEMTGGNAERTRYALDDAANQHPIASFAGDLSGGVMASLGGEAALARAGMASGVGRAVTADMAFGTGTGMGAADGEDQSRLMGGVQGGAAGLVGSMGGQALARGVGSAISPTGGSLDQLYASGVRPTPGQRLVNAGGGKGVAGLVGRAVNATEEGLSSVPIVGSAIRGARQDARDQFQIGAYNEALKEIGFQLPKGMQPGHAPNKFAAKAFDKVYDKARGGMRLAADEELASEISGLGDYVQNLAEPSAKRFETIVKNVVMRRVQGDVLEGEAYKKVQSQLGEQIRSIRKNQSGDGELADALESLQSILDNGARRHSDPKAVKLMDAADRGYAKLIRIEEAAKARGGESGTFTPTQFDRSVQKADSRVRSRAYLQGEALMQDYADQGMSLVDRIPNSGSPERIAVTGSAAGGAAYLEPNTLGLLGAIGLAYAPGVRKAVAGSMAPRGPKAKAIADEVRKKARLTGAVGAAASLSGTQ